MRQETARGERGEGKHFGAHLCMSRHVLHAAGPGYTYLLYLYIQIVLVLDICKLVGILLQLVSVPGAH